MTEDTDPGREADLPRWLDKALTVAAVAALIAVVSVTSVWLTPAPGFAEIYPAGCDPELGERTDACFHAGRLLPRRGPHAE